MSALYSYAQLQNEVGKNAVRLAYIDFKIRFTGFIRRSDLNEEFGLSDSVSSNILSTYKRICPDNFTHDRSNKVNVIDLKSYQPLIPIDANKALNMLAHGFNENLISERSVLPYKKIGHISDQLDTDTVALITRAISKNRPISCCYISDNSSKHDARGLVPLALLNDGRNWIFRAYDRSESKTAYKFKNFNFSRATQVEVLDDEVLNYESLSEDQLWNTPVSLLLELHPNLEEKQKITVRKDFGILPGEDSILITESAALVWILTKLWNIDVGSSDEEAFFFRFRLKNKDMLKNYL